jgi:hypothetical protein
MNADIIRYLLNRAQVYRLLVGHSDVWRDKPESLRLCDALCERYPAAENGPAHVVVSDNNFDDEFIDGALSRVESAKLPADERAATLAVLRRLREIPLEQRIWWTEPGPVVDAR